ncbi:hypothetical protein [Marinicauda pacifica]|uniref:hypothetical protein n=1 Tax=Marinicauda pacifica TaxID=1133559 RepID=UPI0035C830DA
MARANSKLTDAQAKQNFIDSWPGTTSIFNAPDGLGSWVRAQPVHNGENGCPRIISAGQNIWKTQPDCLYIHVGDAGCYADTISFEVCGSQQNFSDKRSRYVPSTSSQLVDIRNSWLKKRIQYKKGERERFKILGLDQPMEKNIPIRHSRVIFALPNDLFDRVKKEICPMAHEYMVRHSSISSPNAPATQRFLKQLSLSSHFLAYRSR